MAAPAPGSFREVRTGKPVAVIDQVDLRCTCELGYCDCCAGGIAAELAGRGYVEEFLTDDDNGVWFRFTKRGER